MYFPAYDDEFEQLNDEIEFINVDYASAVDAVIDKMSVVNIFCVNAE